MERSERNMGSPKASWNAIPTGDFMNAVPPVCPGVCHEYSYTLEKPASAVVKGGTISIRYRVTAARTLPTINLGESSRSQTKSVTSFMMSLDTLEASVRFASKNMGMLAYLYRTLRITLWTAL